MTRKFILPNTPRREKVDAVAKIVKSVCGVSQSDAFNIAKHACVFNVPRRNIGKESGRGKLWHDLHQKKLSTHENLE